VTTTPTPHHSRKLERLGRRLRRAGITRQRVAEEAGVTRPHVSHVLAGRWASANVIATAERLLAEQAAQQTEKAHVAA